MIEPHPSRRRWVFGLLLLAGLAQGCGGASGAAAPAYRPSREARPQSQDILTSGRLAGAPASRKESAYSEEVAEADADDGGGDSNAAPPLTPRPPTDQPEKLAPKGPQAETRPAEQPKSEPARPDDKSKDGRGPRGEGKRAPIVVYTAEFGLQVVDVRAGIDEVERMAREVGGLVSKRTDRMIVIRVPAARFYESVGRIERLGEVTRRDVSAQDVTEEYLDLEVRLRNARALRDRLQVLLARATTVKESIEIERELSRINAELDRMEGRLKYLRDRATFSTITLHLEQRSVASPPPSVRLPFPWLHSPDLARLLSL